MTTDLAQCQLQPYLKDFTTNVISCEPTIEENDKKKKSRAVEKPFTSTYDVVLQDTILYPEGGGQPSDYGWINDSIDVTYVFKNNDGEIIHRTSSPLTPGETVKVTIDWSRRYDHMTQHSGQHLISAIFTSLFDCHTVSWWLASAPSECYIEFNQSEVTNEQLKAVERRCNEIIRSSLPLHMHTFPTVDHALADEHFSSRLPEHKVLGDHLVGTVRVIEIDGIDVNPCAGTHVQNTSELQVICLTKTDSVKGHSRVHFLAGQRALNSLHDALKFTRSMNTLLSSTGDTAVDILKRAQLEHRALAKLTTRQTKELAEFVGQQMFHDLQLNHTQHAESPQRPILITHHREESNMLFLAAVADRFNTLLQEHSLDLNPAPLLFLTCSDSTESKEGQFILVGGPVDQLATLGANVAKAMSGRGGGKWRVQGKVSRIDERKKAIELIKEQLNI